MRNVEVDAMKEWKTNSFKIIDTHTLFYSRNTNILPKFSFCHLKGNFGYCQCTIPAAGNGESCLGPIFRPFPNSHQYSFRWIFPHFLDKIK